MLFGQWGLQQAAHHATVRECCRFRQARQKPVVPRPLVLEFERADAVRDVLQRILDRVRVGIHRVDAPTVAGVVVAGVLDPVQRRVAQVDVRAGHVDLGAQHHRAIGMLTIAHLLESRQVVIDRPVPPRAVDARMAKVATGGAHRIGALLVHIGQAAFDQVLSRAVHEVEIVAGKVQVLGAGKAPVPAQPMHHLDDRVDVFLLFLLRVGVVEAQVADAAEVARQTKVQADALGMADVQVAVGLGRKAQAHCRRVGLTGRLVRRVAR